MCSLSRRCYQVFRLSQILFFGSVSTTVVMMIGLHRFFQLFLLSALYRSAFGSSFYDNPEQDPIVPEKTPTDELEALWGTEV